MAIVELGGGLPAVAPLKGRVAVWCGAPDGEDSGFMLDPSAAARLGFLLVGAAVQAMGGEPGEALGIPQFSCRVDPAKPVSEDMAASLVFEMPDAALAFGFGATELAEIASTLVAAVRKAG